MAWLRLKRVPHTIESSSQSPVAGRKNSPSLILENGGEEGKDKPLLVDLEKDSTSTGYEAVLPSSRATLEPNGFLGITHGGCPDLEAEKVSRAD
jgi:hypothetical protein